MLSRHYSEILKETVEKVKILSSMGGNDMTSPKMLSMNYEIPWTEDFTATDVLRN
jgi:hypothetical protein